MKRAAHRLSQWTVPVAAIAAIIAAATARADDENKQTPTVEACGLRIVGQGYGEGPDMRPFNWTPGVSMVLRIVNPSGGLIGFDSDASKIESFVDDKGTDLLKSDETYMPVGFSSSDDLSEDGKAALIEVDGGTPPAHGTREIHLKGVAVFVVATEKKTFTQKDVKLAADTEIKAGEISFVISKVGKPDWGDEPLEVTLKASTDLTSVAGVRFLDADGKEIESSVSSEMSMSFNESVTVERGYKLARKVDTATIEVTCWMNLEKVNVPVDVTTGVGF